MISEYTWNHGLVYGVTYLLMKQHNIADRTCRRADSGHADTDISDRQIGMAKLLCAISRLMYLVLVLLCLALVAKCCICDVKDMAAIMSILCPENVRTESVNSNSGRNFIQAPGRCPSGERRDPRGRCKELY